MDSRLRQGKRAEQSIELNDVKINSAINEEVSKKYQKIQWKQSLGSNSMVLCGCMLTCCSLLQVKRMKLCIFWHCCQFILALPLDKLAVGEIPLPTVGTANISAFLFCATQLCLKVNITLIKTTWISKLLKSIKKCPVGWQLKNFSILERKCVTGTGIHKFGCDRYVLCAVALWVSLAQDLGSLPCCQLCSTW